MDEEILNHTKQCLEGFPILVYLELTEGYIEKIALDENSEIIGYQYLSLGRFMDFVKAGVPAEEALEKATGNYGRFADGSKYIDPRHE